LLAAVNFQMMTNDLKWIIENGTDEVDYYLENVTTVQFIMDVKELLKKQADKSAIEEAVKRLQELL
jgi:hypothetical protein